MQECNGCVVCDVVVYLHIFVFKMPDICCCLFSCFDLRYDRHITPTHFYVEPVEVASHDVLVIDRLTHEIYLSSKTLIS